MSAQPDFPKRLNHRQALIFLLRDGQWHGMKALAEAGGYRYGARLHELREAGYRIEKRNVFGDVYEYRWNRAVSQAELFEEE